MRSALYPGSFDPTTNGHVDVVERASRLFDRVVVAVAANPGKRPLFTQAQRRKMVDQSVRHLPNVDVATFSGLLVDFAAKRGACVIIRGLRAVSDFEFELQMALMNRKLDETVETIFMMPRETTTFLSSRLVKEIAELGGEVGAFVPAVVEDALRRKLRRRK